MVQPVIVLSALFCCLQFVHVGGGGDGRPDGVCVFYYWTGDCLVGGAQCFFLFPPVGGGQCF